MAPTTPGAADGAGRWDALASGPGEKSVGEKAGGGRGRGTHRGYRGSGPAQGKHGGDPVSPQGKGKGKGGHKAPAAAEAGEGTRAKDEVFSEITLLLEANTAIHWADFDFRVRQQLHALYGTGGAKSLHGALSTIHKMTMNKARENVRNWPAYLLTLLRKFDPGTIEVEGRCYGKKDNEVAGPPDKSVDQATQGKAPLALDACIPPRDVPGGPSQDISARSGAMLGMDARIPPPPLEVPVTPTGGGASVVNTPCLFATTAPATPPKISRESFTDMSQLLTRTLAAR